MSGVRISRRAHGPAGDGRDSALFVNGRFGVHALLGANVTELRVVGRLHEVLRLLRGSRVVADEVEVLAVVGGNREGLLHEAVRFVAVAIRTAVRVLFIAGLRSVAAGCLIEAGSASLALHLAVGQKAARHSAGTP